MAGTQGQADALRRKIAAHQRGETSGAPESAVRAFRLALARAARDEASLDLEVARVTDRRLSLAELLELPPERAFVAMLEGPEGALGVMALSFGFMSGLVEIQTTGRLTAAAPPPRRPTRTDAAMVAGTVDRCLRDLEAALAEAPDLVWAGGFHYASFLDEPRPLGLLLEDEAYRVLDAEVVLDGGARRAQVLLALPAAGRGPKPAAAAPAEGDTDASARAWTQDLQAAVAGATVSLEAVMTRVRLPLDELMALAPGTLLRIGTASVDSIALEARDGRRLAEARLGQNRGMRALRLTRIEGAAQPRVLAPAASPPAPASIEAARAAPPTPVARSA